MNPELSNFANRLREHFLVGDDVRSLTSTGGINEPSHVGSYDNIFDALALELFVLQFKHNIAYQALCRARKLTPETVTHWTQIPAVPTSAFKDLELTSILPAERTAIFHSSGTTEQRPSRHFHCADSLAVYEASLWQGFERAVLRSAGGSPASFENVDRIRFAPIMLTPPPSRVTHSSLVHMFETVRLQIQADETCFVGRLDADGAWTLNFETTLAAIHSAIRASQPALVLGTAFSFVHLLDHLAEKNLKLTLPPGSRVMETGGYKNRSRTMPKAELHALIRQYLGVEDIICEYGMSELSSQAYDGEVRSQKSGVRSFSFPPWARVRIISPETGAEVADGETGLIRIFDLANVFSVAAIQTEDLGVRRGNGFELLGRAQMAEPRGCSLMTA